MDILTHPCECQVVIGRGRVVPAHARITLCQQHQGDVSDDDVEYSKFGQVRHFSESLNQESG